MTLILLFYEFSHFLVNTIKYKYFIYIKQCNLLIFI